MTRRLRLSLPLLTLSVTLGLALVADVAHGFVRTKTCDPAGLDGPYCQPGQRPLEIFWPQPCITYMVNHRGSADFAPAPVQARPILNETLERAILGSAQAWNREECSDATLVFGGVSCSEEVGYISASSPRRGLNINLLIFHEEEWEYASDAIALTSVSVLPLTGEIVDADIEFNGLHFTFEEITEPGRPTMDVRNTLTHEFGHLLGFAHEDEIPGSTMYFRAEPGETSKRALNFNDIDGLCEVYPIREDTRACRPSYPVEDTCAISGVGQALLCDVSGLGAQSAPWSSLLLWLVCACGALVGMRRRGASYAPTNVCDGEQMHVSLYTCCTKLALQRDEEP
jgi:hypothetical protein